LQRVGRERDPHDYLVAVIAEVPDIQVVFAGEPAIANSVHHPTGYARHRSQSASFFGAVPAQWGSASPATR